MRLKGYWLAVVWLVLSLAGVSFGQNYDPPANYYSTATGTGTTLKSQLHQYHRWSYDNFLRRQPATALQDTGEDRIIPLGFFLVYNRVSSRQQDNAATNRRHTWPDSRLGNGGAAVSDLFNLRVDYEREQRPRESPFLANRSGGRSAMSSIKERRLSTLGTPTLG